MMIIVSVRFISDFRYNGNRLLNTVEAFDPVDNTWTLYEESRMHNERCDTGMCVVRFLSCAEPTASVPSTSRNSVAVISADLSTSRNQSDATASNGRSSLAIAPGTPASVQQAPAASLTTIDSATGRLSGPAFRPSDQTTQVQVVTPLFQGGVGRMLSSGGPGGALSRPHNSSFNQSSSISTRGHLPGSVGTTSTRTGVGARISSGLMFNPRSEQSGIFAPRSEQPVSSASYQPVPVTRSELEVCQN